MVHRVAHTINRMSQPLNPKQLKFVELYLAGNSAKQAYIGAGYAARGNAAETNAARLLRKAQVKAAIDLARTNAAEKHNLTAEWVLAGLKREAEREGEGSSHAARVKAYELIGKTFGMFVDRQEHSGPNGDPISIGGEHDHRFTLTAEDLDAADRLAPLAS